MQTKRLSARGAFWMLCALTGAVAGLALLEIGAQGAPSLLILANLALFAGLVVALPFSMQWDRSVQHQVCTGCGTLLDGVRVGVEAPFCLRCGKMVPGAKPGAKAVAVAVA